MKASLSFAVAVLSAIFFASPAAVAAGATITMSKTRYDVGESMQITGSGFTPGAGITLTVQRPDKIVDNVAGVAADANGTFKATYNPPYQPGRYRVTATDGTNTAISAVTEADAIGFNKGVYNKGATPYNDTSGTWTTGNAGSNYLENQWAYYQYQVTGVTTTVPDFDIAFNHYQSNVNALFVDAFANFRACVDCTVDTNTSGQDTGMLKNGVPFPTTDTTYWKIATSAISNINGRFTAQNVCEDPLLYPLEQPAQSNCFKVSGAALRALFEADNPTLFQSGTHTITLYYQAHLASTFVWSSGKEYLLGCPSSTAWVKPIPEARPANTVYGTRIYSGDDPCSDKNLAQDWDQPFTGVGSATGSSRNFQITNQTDGPNGALTLPIPTVTAPTGSITITKVTNPASAVGAVFSFTSELENFQLDTDPSATLSNTKVFSNIPSGIAYTFTESNLPAGWNLTNLTCTTSNGVVANISLVNRQVVITLPDTAGATANCTFTNTGTATITIVKDTTGGNGTFSFTTTGGAPLTAFDLITSGGTANRVFTNVPPGSYTVTETGPTAGWQFGSLACSAQNGASSTISTQTANLQVVAGSSITCTFTNTKQGKLTIVKNTVGGNGDFTFTTTGASPVAGFTLSTSSNTAQKVFDNVPPGNYSVTESGPAAGWQFTSLSCSTGGSGNGQVASIVMPAGGDITCTYKNTKQGKLTIVKNTVGGNGDFTFTTTGASPVAGFTLSTSSNTAQKVFDNVPPGNYSVTESGPAAGWQFTDLSCSTGGTANGQVANIVIPAGGDITCTYTNTKQGKLTIVKNTVGGNGDFTFTTTGASPVTGFTLSTSSNTAQKVFDNVPPGNYSVTESGPAAGWQFTSLSCSTGGSGNGQVASIVMPAGGDITCTYTNTKQGTITIVKNTVGGDGTFAFTASGGAPLAGFNLTTNSNTAQQVFNNVPPGNYSVTESGPSAGWQFASLQCSSGGTVNGQVASIILPAGGNVTCTYTNNKLAKLTIVKNTVGGNGTFDFTTALGNFSLTTSGLTANKVFSNLTAGSYSVAENALSSAWEFGGVSCSVANSGTGQTATVQLAFGEEVTCTFTNRLRPTLTIQKYTTGSGGTFQFNLTGATSLTSSVTTAGIPFFGATTSTPINVGEHTVSETLAAGWTLTDFTCSIGAGTDTNNNGIPDLWTFTAKYGDNVVCSFTNSSGGTTRTQGFWATHTGLANEVWNTAVAGTPAANLCNVGITANPAAGANQLMGGFWAGISQRVANPKKRSDIDTARMQMLQQYLAAVLNVYKFGSGSFGMLDTARAAYCGNDLNLIKAQVGILGSFNTSGDALPFTPGASATAQTSKAQADIKFWDNTTTH